MQGVFVTGTASSVGKTFISCGLANAVRQTGVPVCARKPIEQRCKRKGGALYPSDGLVLAQAGGNIESIDRVTPYRMAGIISPAQTAETEKGAVDTAALIAAVEAGQADYFRVVEGAGGILSPLAIDGSNADLAVALGLPVVIVTSDQPGCINHVLLTAEAIQHRRLRVAAVVVNVPDPDSEGAGSYRDDLAALLDIPVIAHSHGRGDWDASTELARLVLAATGVEAGS
jgi:dethiobiotin synthetase